MNEAAIIAAVDHLNEQLLTLPDDIPCSLEGLYPDFDFPDCGPEMYLALLEDEARQVKAKIGQAEEGPQAPLQRLLLMLVKCAVVLRLAGVTTLFDDDQAETVLPPQAGEAAAGSEPSEPLANSRRDTIAAERPTLTLDLSGLEGNICVIFDQAAQLLPREKRQEFNLATWEAVQSRPGKTYQDFLALVNSYVRLVDSSGWYPEYAAADKA